MKKEAGGMTSGPRTAPIASRRLPNLRVSHFAFLFQQVSKQHSAHAAAAQQAAANQQAHDAAIVSFAAHAFIVVNILAFVLALLFVFVPLAHEVGEQGSADAGAAEDAAADQQAQDAAIAVLALALLVSH